MQGWNLKILYDGKCPMCRREIAWFRRKDTRRRLILEDITEPAFDASRYGLETRDVHAVLHGLLPDGTVITGMEVIRCAYRLIGWGWLWAPTGWPVLRGISDRLYGVWARYRLRLSGRSCDGACPVVTKR